MQGRVLFGEKADPPRKMLFAGRDRGDETVFHVRTVRDERYRYIRNAYPERPFLQINRYKETSYPIIGLLRHLHGRGELNGPPSILMADSRPKEELYDLETDPHEIHNLADDPKFSSVKRKLSHALTAWQDEIDDKGKIAEDPAIARHWENEMKRVYDARIANQPDDWFLTHPSLGPYREK